MRDTEQRRGVRRDREAGIHRGREPELGESAAPVVQMGRAKRRDEVGVAVAVHCHRATPTQLAT